MAETLNKPECEFVGELLHKHLNRRMPFMGEDFKFEVRRVNAILQKLDYPLYEEKVPR